MITQSASAFVLLVFLLICGCSTVGGDVQAGRNALQTGRSDDALVYFRRAADADPNYRIPYRVGAGVLAYLGRAYLETGRDKEARQTLEGAVKRNMDDPFAHLYLGVALLNTGESGRGRKELEEGLRRINDTVEYIAASDSFSYGLFWDPDMQIRSDIRQTLTSKLDDRQFALAGERIGRKFDEEMDQARRDEARRRGRTDGGGSGGN